MPIQSDALLNGVPTEKPRPMPEIQLTDKPSFVHVVHDLDVLCIAGCNKLLFDLRMVNSPFQCPMD